jgi:hypothetical protein
MFMYKTAALRAQRVLRSPLHTSLCFAVFVFVLQAKALLHTSIKRSNCRNTATCTTPAIHLSAVQRMQHERHSSVLTALVQAYERSFILRPAGVSLTSLCITNITNLLAAKLKQSGCMSRVPFGSTLLLLVMPPLLLLLVLMR